jgi:hypothetical protein
VAGLIGNFQAGHFRLSPAVAQIIAMTPLFLRIEPFDVERQAANFLPNLDTERACPVFVEHHIPALQIHFFLQLSLARHAFRPREKFPKQHQGANRDAQGFEERFENYIHDRFFAFLVNTGRENGKWGNGEKEERAMLGSYRLAIANGQILK